MKALITRKIGMTSIIAEDGAVTPVTLLSASPCVVTQVKTIEQDGYKAVAIGFETAKKPNKAQAAQATKTKINPSKVVREIRIAELSEDLSVGTEIKADVFSVGDTVSATGTSKGKGFAGTVKRHNFKVGRKSHGGRNQRRPGSIGSMYPQKIFKGKRMAGQMGVEQVTVKNLKIELVDSENNVIAVKGAVPGPRKSIVLIKGVN